MKTIFGNEAPLPDNDLKVHPMDLVMQLGRVRRFNGSANPEWTVLHHSVLVSVLWIRAFGAEGVHHALAHDFHEYVTGDIPSPVKNAIGCEPVEKLERFLDQRVYELLDEPHPDTVDKQCVKYVDWAALFIEAFYIGLPGHVRHIIDTSIAHLSPQMRTSVAEVVKCTCPEVLAHMEAEGFFTALFVEKKA